MADRAGRRRALSVAAAAVVLIAAGGMVLASRADNGPTRVAASSPGPPPPVAGPAWVAGSDPHLGWAFERPAAWTAHSDVRHCRLSVVATVVTNQAVPLPVRGDASRCPPGWDLAGLPDSHVVVELSHFQGGPAPQLRSPDDPPDSAFPLSMAGAEVLPPPPPGHPAGPPGRFRSVRVNGDSRYSIRLWSGPAATAEDLAAAERIVASVRPTEAPDDGPAPLPRQCPADVSAPVAFDGRVCSGEAPAGNGLGAGGQCAGDETAPPCGPGAEVGRYYPYTLALRCDGLVHFDGRRWLSQLPPPADGGTASVWMRLDDAGHLAFVSPRGAVGFEPDAGQPARPCRGVPAPVTPPASR